MDRVSAEIRTAMFRYRLLRRITTLIRYLEALILTLLAIWSSARIPTAAKASGDFLRHSILPVLLGPRFLFLLGNAIVLTLLCKSRHLTTTSTPPTDYEDGKNGDDVITIGDQISAFVQPPPPPAPAEEVVFEDKNVCVETTTTPAPPRWPRVHRRPRRSKSERIQAETEPAPAELRRSETDVGKVEDPEEFRKVVEAFIEKQLKFQREESMAIVCSDEKMMHHHIHASALTCSAGTVE